VNKKEVIELISARLEDFTGYELAALWNGRIKGEWDYEIIWNGKMFEELRENKGVISRDYKE
jgi:hypothetical protein